jgi:hypothetical protein
VWKGRPYRGGTKTDPEPYLLDLALSAAKELASKNKGLIVAALGGGVLLWTLAASKKKEN